MVEPVDVAYDRFVSMQREIAEYLHSVKTEADTRLKIIDRILGEVLQWPHRELFTESATDSGFVDYVCTASGRARLIVEAKRDGRDLGCAGRQAGRPYRLNGGVFKEEAAKEGISQGIRYCGERSAELACVTNGREWIVFRGSRLGDGRDVRSGMAFVFPSLAGIEEKFQLFYNLLAYESAGRSDFRPYFNEAEGQPIRLTVFNKPVRPQGTARFIRSGKLAADLDRIMSSFFSILTGDDDPEILDACFVETNESRAAETRLRRIAEGLLVTIAELDTADADGLTSLIRRTISSQRHEFVIVVGAKGAGKSTFVTRFFRQVLPDDLSRNTVVVKVDLKKSAGDTATAVQWLDRTLLEEAERALFPVDPPDFNEIEGMFYDEYTRLKKGSWKVLYERDHQEFRIRFGEKIERLRDEHPHEYIEGLLRHIVRNQLKVPVLVFDNADHFDIAFQQLVYQYARSYYEKVLCLILLPITDRTSWQLSKQGPLQSFEHVAFYLPTPSTDLVIKKRIEYLEQRIESVRSRPDDKYFDLRGITLSLADLAAFARTLQRVFLQTSRISRWIGDLANYEVRRALVLARGFASSPHLRVEDLLKAYITNSSIDLPANRAMRALVRGSYDIYPTGQHDYVQNIFALSVDLETTPLLGARILRLLADVPVDEHEGQLIQVDQVLAYFSGTSIEPRATSSWLDAMLKTGLCLSYDPSIRDIEETARIEISPSGRLHLSWLANGNLEYLGAMADVTPVLSEEMHHSLEEYSRIPSRWREKTRTFVEYFLDEDSKYCLLPEHESYQSQRRLVNALIGVQRRLEGWIATGVDARLTSTEPASHGAPGRAAATAAVQKAEATPAEAGAKAPAAVSAHVAPIRRRSTRDPMEGQQALDF